MVLRFLVRYIYGNFQERIEEKKKTFKKFDDEV